MLLQDLGDKQKVLWYFPKWPRHNFWRSGSETKTTGNFSLCFFFRHHLYHKWEIINITLSSSYGSNMDAINKFLFKRFTGVENMTSDNVVKG